jgi:hypothetical protein
MTRPYGRDESFGRRQINRATPLTSSGFPVLLEFPAIAHSSTRGLDLVHFLFLGRQSKELLVHGHCGVYERGRYNSFLSPGGDDMNGLSTCSGLEICLLDSSGTPMFVAVSFPGNHKWCYYLREERCTYGSRQ